MSERHVLADRLSIDSGVLIAYLLGEKLGELARTDVLAPGQRQIFLNRLAIVEAYYIACRRKGRDFAQMALDVFLKTRYAELVSSNALDIEAASYKCERKISLADCYVLATAKIRRATALFAKGDRDLVQEISRRSFDVQILFLEDLV